MGGVVSIDSRNRCIPLILIRVSHTHVDPACCEQAFAATMIETHMLLTWLLAVVA